MTVQVMNNIKAASVESGAKPASSKKNPGPENKGLFESVLSTIKDIAGDSASKDPGGAPLEHRPATAAITNPEFHKANAKSVNSGSSMARNINNMAVSALISASALSSGQNRMSGLNGMSAAMLGRGVGGASSTPAQSYSCSNSGQGVGGLSAKFESGECGPAVIGYDDGGGTSYGTYQIASRVGSMRQFIDYLHEKAPDIARRLEAAGPANTGSRKGKMPEVWKKIASEDSAKFAKLQYDYIEQSHYLPALKEIAQNTGVDIAQAPKAIKEVLWSTAVQHGAKGAAKIFTKAIAHSKTKSGGIQAAQLINSVYSMRAGQFGSSSNHVRMAVRNRFKVEGQIALAMLSEPYAPDSARA